MNPTKLHYQVDASVTINGNTNPERTLHLVVEIEPEIYRKAEITVLPAHKFDVYFQEAADDAAFNFLTRSSHVAVNEHFTNPKPKRLIVPRDGLATPARADHAEPGLKLWVENKGG